MSLLPFMLMAATSKVALSFVGTKAAGSSSSTSRPIPLPAGCRAGDTAIYQHAYDGSPSGFSSGDEDITLRAWDDAPSPVGADISTGIWVKTLTPTDISNGEIQTTATFRSGANAGVGKVAVFRGVTALELVGEAANSLASSIGIVDPSGTGNYVLFADLDDDLSTVSSWPASYTEGRDQATGGVSGSGSTGAVAVAMNADPGAESLTWSSSDATISALVKVT